MNQMVIKLWSLNEENEKDFMAHMFQTPPKDGVLQLGRRNTVFVFIRKISTQWVEFLGQVLIPGRRVVNLDPFDLNRIMPAPLTRGFWPN